MLCGICARTFTQMKWINRKSRRKGKILLLKMIWTEWSGCRHKCDWCRYHNIMLKLSLKLFPGSFLKRCTHTHMCHWCVWQCLNVINNWMRSQWFEKQTRREKKRNQTQYDRKWTKSSDLWAKKRTLIPWNSFGDSFNCGFYFIKLSFLSLSLRVICAIDFLFVNCFAHSLFIYLFIFSLFFMHYSEILHLIFSLIHRLLRLLSFCWWALPRGCVVNLKLRKIKIGVWSILAKSLFSSSKICDEMK